MTITVRLDAETTKALARAAKERGLTKSELIRESVREYLDTRGDGLMAWELGKDLFGKHSSNHADLAGNSKRIARERVHAKAKRRGRGTSRRAV